MDLYRNEYEKLKTLLAGKEGMKNGWIHHPNRELEATFGLGGQVDQTRFLAVAQRLKSKGYVENPPVDYMTITIKDQNNDINIRRETLKDNTRFTVEGSANVEQYCNDESLANVPYEVILKTAIGDPNDDNLVLEDYEMKFKVRREEERAKDDGVVRSILTNWDNEKKAFRLIRRWTFEGDGCVFDLSMVRSNKRNSTGAYIFTKSFAETNLLAQLPSYEIEVELKHTEETKDVKVAMAKLIKAVGEVLRGIQRSPVLIRKTIKKRALDAYVNLVGNEKFRGVKPHTLEMKNFITRRLPNTPNIRDGYNVTDKADGLRVLGFCDAKGELFLIDKAMNVYRTGLLNESCRNSLVDGEWITSVKDSENPDKQKGTQQLWLFDIYIGPNKEVVDSLPFYSSVKDTMTRYKKLRDWYGAWVKDGPTTLIEGLQAGSRLLVNLKHFEFAGKDDTQIFEKAKIVLGRQTEYVTDGLIFTSNSAPLPGPDANFREQFKWKPSQDNTIDFLVRVQKDPENPLEDLIETEERSDSGRLTRYKTLILKVGSTMNPACANPRDTILYERDYPKGGCRSDKFYRDSKGKYTAVAFNPSEYADPLASICKVELQRDPDTQLEFIATEKTQEPIQDRSIVEMRYDMKNPDGWRWIPVRIRTDKTEKLERGELGGTLNADFTAEGVWSSIHNPITKGMITTGNEAPTSQELEEEGEDDRLVNLSKPYFERKANKEQLQSVEGLRNFHKHFVKGETLLKSALKGGNKYLLDLAVGEGADINRWIANQVGFVYGIDIDPKGILDSRRGAYTKYINRLSENAGLPETEQILIPPMIFGIGNASKNLETGDAGLNEEEANILRTVFGKIKPTNSPPPFVVNQGKDKLKEGADVIACMFALHYFFKDKETFQGLLNNIKQNLRVDGYFIACFFDGQKVFDLLKTKKEGESVTGADRKFALWRITKRYSESTLPTDDSGFGLAIQNQFISIGAEHTEYLVPYELFQSKMAEIGCLPVMGEDLKQLGLPVSTETFDQTYKRAIADAKKKGTEPYPMIKPVQDYSFLNRWCIFKRYSGEVVKEEEAVLRTVAKVIGEVNKEEQKEAEKPVNTLAWRDVPTNGTAGPTPVLEAPVSARSVKQAKSANLATLARGPPGEKPIESMGNAMAGIGAVTVPLDAPTEFPKDKVFYFAAQEQDTKEIKDEGGAIVYPDASRYLAPYTPFTIVDEEDPKDKVPYPSILHFLSGMMYKRATNKPQWAKDLFSREGSIHQTMLGEKLKLDVQFANKEDPKYKDKLQTLLLNEAKEIASKAPIAMKKKYSTLDYKDATWDGMKDDVLRSAYQVRYDKDAKFRDILSKLREAEKYLLYRPTPTVTTDLGGVTKVGKRNTKNQKGTLKVEGENKLGKLLMKLAKFPGYEGKIESNEDQGDE